MISNLVYNVPGSRTPKPSYVLTQQGHEKVKDALEEKLQSKYENITNQTIVNFLKNSFDRNTIAKIRNGNKGVNFQTLENFSNKLDISFNEGEDYQELPRTAQPHKTKPSISSNNNYPSIDETKIEKLKKALWEIDYDNQQNLFKSAISQVKPAAAFLIHGKPNYGQRWLVNLLKDKVPYHTNAWQKSLYIKPHRRDIQTLWQSLSQQLETSPSPQEIAVKLYQHWQTTTVILAIHEVDLIAGSCLKQFINELWQPLVNKVNSGVPPQHPYRLLLFLVDNTNSKSKLETSLSLLSQPDINQPHVPLALQELEPFNKNVIETWVGVQFELLSQLWQGSDSIEKVMQTIVERDNQPISVLGKICECFDLEWEQDIVRGFAL